MYEDESFDIVEVAVGIAMIIVCCVVLAIICSRPSVDKYESVKAVIHMGNNEDVVVDVKDYHIQSSGLAVIKAKDGKEYQTSNYTIITNEGD